MKKQSKLLSVIPQLSAHVPHFQGERYSRLQKLVLATGLLTVALILCSCSDAGQYFSRSHYSERSEAMITSPAEGAAINNYDALYSAVKNAIDVHKTEEVLMVKNYDGDWTEDIQEIQREMLEEYPYGRYAINNLGFSSRTVFTQTEIRLSITYRDSAVYMRDIIEVPDIGDFERRMSELMRDFTVGQAGDSSISRVFYFTGFDDSDDDFSRRLIKCWTSNAARAVELREISFSSYPVDGAERIVEVNIQYIEDRNAMLARSERLYSAARLAALDFVGQTDEEKLDYIYRWLWENVEFDTDSMGLVIEMDGTQSKRATFTAYGALIDGVAAQSGYALAAQALCDTLGMSSRVVTGHFEAIPYYWLYVELDGDFVHFDPSAVKIDRWLNPPPPPEVIEESEQTEPAVEEEDFSLHRYLFSSGEAMIRFRWNSKVYGAL